MGWVKCKNQHTSGDRAEEGDIVVVVVFTLKAVPVSTQYFLTSVLVQLTRTPTTTVFSTVELLVQQ